VNGDPVNFGDPSGTNAISAPIVPGDCDGDPGFFGCGDDFQSWGGPCGSVYVMTYVNGMQMPSPCDFAPVFFQQQSAPSPTCYDWTCMPAAFARAIQGLSLNADCMSLFGTAQTRAGGFNPISVLSNIVYGSNSLGSINFSTHSASWGVAETRPAGLLPIPGLAGKVSISINQSAGYGFWNNGDTVENADTLLHELGHAFNDLKGAGGFALPNSAEKNDPYAFGKLIQQKCF
jgi:hypothetical protein